MVAKVSLHSLIQAFREARKGDALNTKTLLAQRAILKEIKLGGGQFEIGPLQIAHKSGIDSLVIAKFLDWWLEAGYLEKATCIDGRTYYKTSDAFRRVYGPFDNAPSAS